MATELERAAAESNATEYRLEWSYDLQNQMVLLAHRHRLELPAAARVVPIPFAMVKLMAGQVLTIEAQLTGLLPPQGGVQELASGAAIKAPGSDRVM